MYNNNQQNHLQKFMIIISTRQSFDKGCRIMKLLFRHDVFIVSINISCPPPPLLRVSPLETYTNSTASGLSVFTVFPICRPGTFRYMVPLISK